jgi:hypothetical protein
VAGIIATSSPRLIFCRIALLVSAARAMNVIAASRRKESTYMRTYTIDTDNSITVFATKKEAAAASATPFDSFTNQDELAELTTDWPMQRLVEIWNGIPGVNAVTNSPTARSRPTGFGKRFRTWEQLPPSK